MVENIVNYFTSFDTITSFLGTFFAIISYMLLKHFLPGYFNQLGKNAATKKDIEEITTKVESIKHNNAELLESLKTNNQLIVDKVDREKQLKKEVYLDAVSAINSDQLLLSLITNLDITMKEINIIRQQNSEKVAKVHITGSIETLKHLTALNTEIGESFIELIPIRLTIDNKNKYKQGLENLIKEINNNQSSILDKIDRIKDDGKLVSKEQFEHFTKAYTAQQENYEEVNNEINVLHDEISQLQSELSNKSLREFVKTSKLIAPAVVSVRKELDLEIDYNQYENIVKKGLTILNQFLPEDEKIIIK